MCVCARVREGEFDRRDCTDRVRKNLCAYVCVKGHDSHTYTHTHTHTYTHIHTHQVVVTLFEMDYSCIKHVVPLFNPQNFRGVQKNIFAHVANNVEVSVGSHMMICAPKGTNISLGVRPAGMFQNIGVQNKAKKD